MNTNFAKTIADNWFETQKKAIQIINDAQDKVISHDALNDLTKNNIDIYNSWLQDQEKIVEEQLSTLEKNTKDFTNTTSNPTNMMDNMMDQFKNMSQFYMDSQKKFFNNMTQNNTSNENFEPYMNMYKQWQNNWMETMNSYTSKFENNDMANAWKGMLGQFEFFNNFNNMMSPFFNSMKNTGWDAKKFENYFNPQNYFSFINQMMGFNNQQNNMMNQWMENMKQFTQNATSQSTQFFPTAFGWQKAWFENMNKFTQPMEMMMAPDQNKANMDMMKEMIEKSTLFQIKGAEFQQKVYEASIEALQSTTKEISEKMMSEDNHITDMKDFYTIWMNNMDKHLIELYNTKEYSKLQGEMSQLGFQLKKLYDNAFETMMADTPFVMNSRMDDMAKTVTDMKREIRSLKKQIKDMSATATASATAKKATTSKAKK